ncbi:MAG: hypothetical protein L0170_06245, partial [Acidobacteria bacterium]|nr:hypothetical protein [Acidobacteriota bacterium]
MAQEQAQPIALPALLHGSQAKIALCLTKLRPILPFVVVLALWQLASMQVTGGLKLLFPTPLAVLIRAWELTFHPLFTAWMAGEVQGL